MEREDSLGGSTADSADNGSVRSSDRSTGGASPEDFSETGSSAEAHEAREAYYRQHHASHSAQASVPYTQALDYYQLGDAAARRSEYAGRRFEDVEADLRRELSGPEAGDYDLMRDFYRAGFEYGAAR